MLRISACSYEGSLFGWNVPLEESEDDILREVKFDFGFHASHGALRSIACSKSGKYMATGGTNERISVYSLSDNQEMGELPGHLGAITYLQFFQDSFLISASEDNTMYIWRCYDWENIHILGGHKDIVNAFAIHPTGKVALSVSKDKTLKIWNLIDGRCSLSRKLASSGEFVVWHPRGDYYLIGTSFTIQVYSTATNETVVDLTMRSRINQVSFVQFSEDAFYILYICDNQTLNLLDMTGKLVKSLVLTSLGVGRLKSFSSSYDASDSKIYISFITSNGALLVVDGNELISQMHSSEALLPEAVELAKSTLQLIKPVQISTAQRPVSAALTTTAAQDEITFASTLIAHHQLPSEPRLVSVSCFLQKKMNPTKKNSNSSSTASSREAIDDAEEGQVATNQATSESSNKKKRKDKKRKLEQLEQPTETDNVESKQILKKSKKTVAFQPVTAASVNVPALNTEALPPSSTGVVVFHDAIKSGKKKNKNKK